MTSGLRWTPEQLAAHRRKQAIAPRPKGPDTERIPKAISMIVPSPHPLITAKPSKYRNRPTDGYASAKEAKRAALLKYQQASGRISELEEQVKYILIPRQDDENGKCLFRAVTYTLDFRYRDEFGKWCHEDVKGYANDRWPMKRALMYWVHRILVDEV